MRYANTLTGLLCFAFEAFFSRNHESCLSCKICKTGVPSSSSKSYRLVFAQLIGLLDRRRRGKRLTVSVLYMTLTNSNASLSF